MGLFLNFARDSCRIPRDLLPFYARAGIGAKFVAVNIQRHPRSHRLRRRHHQSQRAKKNPHNCPKCPIATYFSPARNTNGALKPNRPDLAFRTMRPDVPRHCPGVGDHSGPRPECAGPFPRWCFFAQNRRVNPLVPFLRRVNWLIPWHTHATRRACHIPAMRRILKIRWAEAKRANVKPALNRVNFLFC